MTTETRSQAETGWGAQVAGEITAIAVRPQGTPAVAVGTEDGSCWWINATGTVTDHTSTGVDVPTAIAIHPHRDEVTVTGPMGYAVWAPGGPAERVKAGWCSAAAYNKHGDLAVSAGKSVAIRYASGEVYTSAPAPSTTTDVAWSPRANRVAVSAYGGVYVYDGRSPDPVRTHPYTGSHLALAINPSGRWICSGNQDASIHIWRTADNSELQMSGFPEKVTRLAFDDSGRWLANNGAPDITVWDFIGKGPDGRGAQMLAGHDAVADLDWCPGPDAILASAGIEGDVRIWVVKKTNLGRETRPRRTLDLGDVRALRWLDRRRLVVARDSGIVQALDVTP